VEGKEEGALSATEPLRRAQQQALIYARELAQLHRQEKAERQELERRLQELALAQEQAVAYARDLSQAYRAERERSRQLRAALEELEATYNATLHALIIALDTRDNESAGHSQRVVDYTLAIARALGVEGQDLDAVARGALLHDIGKIGVPDAILRKPGPLTEEEWAQMREHPTIGYRMLKDIPFLAAAAEIVYAHEERYDGRGYPRGLAGEAIPLGARLFAVADTLDAITSDRPYRQARSRQQAVEEILRCKGTQFDPQVVEAFLKVVDGLKVPET
jgi:putative nucleotidyltransferase with HDIG domain